jgi:cation-transporting ATPase 13A1
VFQFFCSILWLLDEYWKYTLFTLFMIVSFEATTALTRLKNMGTLGGMSMKPYAVYIYRFDVGG